MDIRFLVHDLFKSWFVERVPGTRFRSLVAEKTRLTIVLKMVVKEKSSEVGKSTSELANHTSKFNFLAQIDLKVNNADVEKTRKPEKQKNQIGTFPKHPKSLKSV